MQIYAVHPIIRPFDLSLSHWYDRRANANQCLRLIISEICIAPAVAKSYAKIEMLTLLPEALSDEILGILT
jgi:hypothetical protein